MIITRKKLMLIMTMVTCFVLLITSSSYADIFSSGKSSMLGNLYIHNSSVSNYGYTSVYNNAVNNWSGISSKVSFMNGISSGDRIHDEYFVDTTSTPGLFGYHVPMKKWLLWYIVASVDETWAYSEVVLYDNQITNYGANKNQIATHEIGHSLALGHTTDPYASIMRAGNGNPSTTIQSYDRSELTRKWGN